MCIKNLLKVLLIFLFLSCIKHQAQATHLYGGEFTYEYIGPSGNATNPFQYRIIYKIYRGGNAGSQVSFRFYQKSGTSISTSLINAAGTSVGTNVSFTSESNPLPLPTPPGCTISGLPSIRLWTYDYRVNLPLSFDGYYATADIGARNNDITNLQNPGTTNLFTYMEMPSPLLPGKSPVFTDTAVVVMFAGDTTSIINSAFDADGDKLIYSFNQPFNTFPGSNFVPSSSVPPRIPYFNSTYSITNPFGAGGYASLNASTGLATYYAPTAGNYVVSFQVKEYRNINGTDVLIGSTIRDIQIIVKNITLVPNAKPTFTYNGSKTINIVEGQAIPPINFTFNDADAAQRLTISISSPLLDGPGNKNASFTSASIGTVTSSPAKLTSVVSGTTAIFNYTSVCGEANTYPLDITISDNACPPGKKVESFQVVVGKYQGPANINGDTTVCTASTEAYNVASKASATYQWRLQGGGTIVGSATNPNVQVSWTTPGRYKLTAIETSTGSCRDSVSFFVNVGLGLNLTVNPPLAICAGASANLSAAGATNYTWTSPGGPTLTGSNVTVSPTSTTTYNLVGTNGTCTGNAAVTVTVNQRPVVDAGPDRTVCAGSSTTLSVTAQPNTTYTWTNGTNTFTGNSITVSPSANTTYTVTANNTTTTCTNSDQVALTVTPGPTPSLAFLNSSYCVNNGPITLDASQGTYTINGTAVSGTLNPASFSPGVYTVVVSQTSGTCTGTATKLVTLNAAPAPSLAFLNSTYCTSNAAVTIPAPATGTSAAYTLNGAAFTASTFNPATLGPGTYTIGVTETNSSTNCSGTATKTVTINAAPTPSLAFLNSTYCANASAVALATPPAGHTNVYSIGSTTLTGSFNPATLGPGTFTVSLNQTNTSTNCSGSVTKTVTINAAPAPSLAFLNSTYCTSSAAVTIPAPVVGNTTAYTVNGNPLTGSFNPATLGPGTYTVGVTETVNASSCSATATKTVTIYAAPAPSLAFLNSTYCANAAAVTLVTAPSGSTNAYTVNGNPLTSSFNPATLGPGTYTVAVNQTNTSTNCNGTATKTVVVNAVPAPSLAFLNANYCSNDGAVTIPSPVVGNTTAYTVNGNPLTGSFNPATLGPGTYTIGVTETNTSTCAGTSTKTVTINAAPIPTLAFLNNAYCATDAAVTLTAAPTGSTNTYSINGTTVTGTFNPSVLGPGNYTVGVSQLNNTTNCTGTATKNVTINAVPAPSLAFLNNTYCANDAAVTIPAPVTGNATSYTLNGTALTGTFNPATLGPGTYTVGVTETINTTTCSASATKTVTINPVPAPSLAFLNNTYCANSAAINLLAPAGNTTSYTINGAPVTGTTLDPAVLGPGSYTIGVSQTNITTSCTGTATKSITINAVPAPSLAFLNNTYCANDAAVTIPAPVTGNATSYTLNGTALTGSFNPATLGPGTYTIGLIETVNSTTCNASASKTVTINAVPTPSLAILKNTYCLNEPAIALTPNSTGTSFFTVNGSVTFGTFTFLPSAFGVGTHTIELTETNPAGCVVTVSKTLNIIAAPVPSLAFLNTNYCANDAAVALPTPVSGNTADYSVNGTAITGSFNPATLGPGTYTVGVTETNTASTCAGTLTKTVTINPVPVPSLAFLNNTYCSNDAAVTIPAPVAGNTTAYTLNGAPLTSSFNPTVLGPGTYTVGVTEINSSTCAGTATKTITINAAPVPTLAFLNSSYCANDAAITLPGGTGGHLVNYTIDGVMNQMTFDPATLGAGPHTISVTESTAITNGCQASINRSITINAVPAPSFVGLNLAYCKNEAAVTLAANLTGSTFTIDGVNATTLNPATLGPGTHTVVVTNTNATNCTGTATQTVTINTVPVPSLAFLNNTYCANASAVTLPTPAGNTTSYTINGTAITGTTFDPVALGPGTYTVGVSQSNNATTCAGTDSKVVTINAVPAPSLAFLNSTYCANDAAVSIPAPVAGNTTAYTLNGVAFTGSAFNPATLGPGTYTVGLTETTSVTGCATAVTKSVTINAVPAPSLAFLSSTYCANATAVTIPTPVAGNTATYTVNGNPMTGSFNPATLGPGTYTVAVTETTTITSCAGTATKTVIINAAPAPSLAFLNTTYCANDAAVSLPAPVAGNTAAYTVNGNPITGSFNPTTLGAGTYTVAVNEAISITGCSTSATKTVTINAVPAPSLAFLNTSYCANDAAVSIPTPVTGNTAAYTLNGTPFTAASFDPTVLGPGTYSIGVSETTTITGCTGTATKSVTINAVPAPSLAFLNNTYCANAAAVTIPTPVSGNTATYTVNGNPLTGSFNPATLGPGTYTVGVTETTTATSCAGTATKSVTINPAPLSDLIAGPVSVCPGITGITYQIINPRETNYQWSINGGTIVSGQGTTSITVNWGAASAATISAAAVNTFGCTGTASVLPVTVNPILTTAQPVGPISICQNQANQIRYVMPNPTPGSTFTWNIPGATVNSNTIGDTVMVNWNTPGTYSIIVQENSSTSLANCFGTSTPLTVTILASPSASLAISGPLSVCENDPSAVAYSLPGAGTSSTFAWTYTFNGVTTTLPSTSSGGALFTPGAAGQYTLSVTETNAAACTGTPITQLITVTPRPVADTIKGPAVVCPKNLSNHLYYVQGAAGAQYNWQVSGGSFTPTTNDSIYVNWDTTPGKSIVVTPVSANGCSGAPFTLNVILDPSELILASATTDEQNDKQVVLNFNMPGNSQNRKSIDIYRREPGVATAKKITTVPNSTPSFTDTDVRTSDIIYTYYLVSTNECGDSLRTTAHNTIVLAKPTANEKEKSVMLKWNSYNGWGTTGVARYEIYVKADDGNLELQRQVGANETEVTLTNITGKGFNQVYRVKAVSNDGRSSWSNATSLSFANELTFYNIFTPNNDNHNDNFVVDNIQLYPGNELSIFNRWGKEVYRKKNYDNSWNGKDMADGTYYYFMKLPDGRTYKGWVEIVR
jgi:gliding motility-associated-like protein